MVPHNEKDLEIKSSHNTEDKNVKVTIESIFIKPDYQQIAGKENQCMLYQTSADDFKCIHLYIYIYIGRINSPIRNYIMTCQQLLI